MPAQLPTLGGPLGMRHYCVATLFLNESQLGARDLAQHGGLEVLAAALEDPVEVRAAVRPVCRTRAKPRLR
jgi:hypothetical protein